MHKHVVSRQFYPVTETTFNDASLAQGRSAKDIAVQSQRHCRHNLLQLIRQHQNQPGWILLVAPAHLPDKEWAERYQLSLHNVLVIHPKQISDLYVTIRQALESSSCKVVINFGNQLQQQQIITCRKLALHNHTWFYQCEHVLIEKSTH
jgi:cell division inhibitor SulA